MASPRSAEAFPPPLAERATADLAEAYGEGGRAPWLAQLIFGCAQHEIQQLAQRLFELLSRRDRRRSDLPAKELHEQTTLSRAERDGEEAAREMIHDRPPPQPATFGGSKSDWPRLAVMRPKSGIVGSSRSAIFL